MRFLWNRSGRIQWIPIFHFIVKRTFFMPCNYRDIFTCIFLSLGVWCVVCVPLSIRRNTHLFSDFLVYTVTEYTPPANICDSLRPNENRFLCTCVSSYTVSILEEKKINKWNTQNQDSEHIPILNYARVPCALHSHIFKSICAKDIFKKSVHK